mmetsp:Transcript_20167/g.33320  ORF Transcript_20167/g.33320 Transcript_20167/m.33320 type:complete len:224 (-) Transcript_20167:39-710(-)|eukprot:CAMPEP_0203748908 /NCGR_PEP_ID=MMETSP0098-20131031/3660_1 /ASSEMBLY_ACC=CAM_ASM_000208 /TAXON_ID=96639 /ORGANISM=" , Strain NY0313808BC1" /LENGTH=223 /DNA_ID=CAMNT_0050637821 /DNA_START=322 /DNA_END=993 /DNA_ORIENTATION=-
MQANKALANKATVFVGNIPFDTSESRVMEIMSQVAPIKNFKLITDKNSGMPKGYGFCEYFHERDAVHAVNSLDQQEINGRRLKVDFSSEGQKGKEETSISPETKKAIEGALKKLTMSELYEVVSEMKMLIQRDRRHAENLLLSKPELGQALLTAQLMLGMAQISADVSTNSGSSGGESDEQQALVRHFLSLSDAEFQEKLDQADPQLKEKLLEIRHQATGGRS